MRVLIADADPVSRAILCELLAKWDYDFEIACDGIEALQAFQRDDPPMLALLDWMLPGLLGTQICRMVRQSLTLQPPYIILFTARRREEDLIAALDAGADDVVGKPCEARELQARLSAAGRIVSCQETLAGRVRDLEEIVVQAKRLQGLVPICAYCKRIRDDQDSWQQIEDYLTENTEARFTHGVCPSCLQSAYNAVA